MAYPPANARRMLRTILADPDYGADLARLGRADERAVLDLISEGKGREARKEITARTQARIGRERTARRVALQRRAARNMYAKHGTRANPTTIDRNVTHMTDAQLRTATTADRDTLITLARSIPPPPATGSVVNPFWYH